MKDVVLFCEDAGHERFVTALVERLSAEYDVSVDVTSLSAMGGHGRMLADLRTYVDDLRSIGGIPDLIVVARDSNCRGVARTQSEIDACLEEYSDFAILAIPNPHVERWLLVDSSAFKDVLGAGCNAPDEKCDRGRYKRVLAEAVREAADINPALGGLEYTADLVDAMDLDRMTTADDSLGTFLQTLRQQFDAWRREAS